MLTGQADVATAIDGINRGALFRFLTKPCPAETLITAIEAGLQQYQLVTAERQILDQTLAGAVKVLTEVLSLVNPSASSRALRVRRLVSHIVERLQLRDRWQLEVASLLSQIGYLTLGVDPDTGDGEVASIALRRQHDMHPAAARDLLANIPRLEQVAAIVGRQREPYDPADAAMPLPARDAVKLGAQVLRVAIEFDAGMCGGLTPDDALSGSAADGPLRPAARRGARRRLDSGGFIRPATGDDERPALGDDAGSGCAERERAAADRPRPRGHAAAAHPAAVAGLDWSDRQPASSAHEGELSG